MHIKFLLAVGIGCAGSVLPSCSSAEAPRELVAQQRLAIEPCDPSAPFESPTKLFPEGPGAEFTTFDFDGLTFSSDGDTIYLSSPHQANTSFDIMRSDKDGNGDFVDPWVVTTLTTANVDDRAPFLRADGQTLYLHRVVSGYNDIFSASFNSGTGEFNAASALGNNVNTNQHDQDPFYSEINDTLYFASEVSPSSIKDIYYLNGGTRTALPTGTTAINHPDFDDYRPVLSADGLVLYFASKRSGIGGDTDGDIWMATRSTSTGTFGTPTAQNILNRSGRDFPVALSSDKCTLYFASNRETGLGSTDHYRLYKAERPETTPSTVTLQLQISGTGSVTTSPFNCSHSGPGFGGTGTCSANLAPGTVQQINASSSSTWSGSCTSFTNPDSNGLAIWAEGGVCRITIL